MSESAHNRSASATRKPPSHPSTPLRPSSRTSLRESQSFTPGGIRSTSSAFPLEALEPAFAELSDSMADLEANFMHLQLMHESLSRFNESFASFLYGMNMNAFCVDFPEAPILESFQRAAQKPAAAAPPHSYPSPGSIASPMGRAGRIANRNLGASAGAGDETFLTTDTSFVDHPTSTKPSRFSMPAASALRTTQTNTSQTRSGPTTSKRGGSALKVPRGGAASSNSTNTHANASTRSNTSTRGTGSTSSRGRASGIARGRARAL